MAKKLIILLFFLVQTTTWAVKPESKYLRKAQRQIENGNLIEAKKNYQKAIEKNPNSFKANLGMGLLLSEFLSNYTSAQPFLEKANSITGQDTVPALIFALAKCYQHNGDFNKAITYFNLLDGFTDPDNEVDIQKEIVKRINDCNYALKHTEKTQTKELYIVNIGSKINSDMPEYVPVLTPQNELIFTSRRKDHEKEQLSYLDGKYFESMYISKINDFGMSEPRQYTLPDKFRKIKKQKDHTSVVSMSPDGSILFTFHNNKIYEIKMDQRTTEKPRKSKTVNFDFYQNHAFLCKDNKTLYFTSEGKGSKGGLDIFKSVKAENGEWSEPENLGYDVNTEFDEDSPFVTEDGNTLYFASNGHEGYGNFDLYRSKLINGKWGPAENLGQPINSPGHDIFMVLDSKEINGYFSSSRNGGYGDMDIYKINYLTNLNRECTPGIDILSLNIKDDDKSDFKNTITANISNPYNVIASEWKVNEVKEEGEKLSFTKDYLKDGSYAINYKVIVYCDTCFAPLVACKSIENKFELEKAVVTETKTEMPDLSKIKGELSSDQLKALGYNASPIYFDFDKSTLSDEFITVLKNNAVILKKHKELHLEIIGYTDAKGTEKHNKRLSNKRAKIVREILIQENINPNQILQSKGKGADNPVIDCQGKDCGEEAHKQNRRVETKVFSK
ncbi:MAG: OmpA family protein [Sphingobacteriaceae bacterium]|nr:OmpA family protein [Sphingobacteriaceae bacterium]